MTLYEKLEQEPDSISPEDLQALAAQASGFVPAVRVRLRGKLFTDPSACLEWPIGRLGTVQVRNGRHDLGLPVVFDGIPAVLYLHPFDLEEAKKPLGQGIADMRVPARCPYCGDDELRHSEEVEVVRSVLGFDASGVLAIESLRDVVNESAHAERIFCTSCERDSEMPAEVHWE
jgi:hypothetical protein